MNVSEVIYMYPLESQLIKAGIIFRGSGNDLKPGIMKGSPEENYLYLVMPVRL